MSRSAIIIREVDSNSTLEILWLFPLSSVGQSAQRWIWRGRRFESFSEIAKTVLSRDAKYFYFFSRGQKKEEPRRDYLYS